MPRIIRRPKKVCTINRSGKKKCFTIQARRRLNPDVFDRDFAETEVLIKLSNIKNDLSNLSDRQLMNLIIKLSEFELEV